MIILTSYTINHDKIHDDDDDDDMNYRENSKQRKDSYEKIKVLRKTSNYFDLACRSHQEGVLIVRVSSELNPFESQSSHTTNSFSNQISCVL